MSQPYLFQWELDIADALYRFDPRRVENLYDRIFNILIEEVQEAVVVSKFFLVPVKSGFLRSCIDILEIDRIGLTITAGVAGCHYGIYVEFGTSKMEARPFWRPAIWEAIFRFMDRAQEELARWARGE